MPTIQRLLTDDTGQALVTAINNVVAAVKPNATEIQMSSSDTTTVATEITNINSKIGTVPSGQTVEGQITTLNSNINAVGYETLLNDSIAISDGNWQTFTTTVNLSNAKYIIMVVGSHGAIYNEVVIPIGAVTNVGLEHYAYAYWDETDLGQMRLNRNGTVNVLAKTGSLAFDYRLYKAI